MTIGVEDPKMGNEDIRMTIIKPSSGHFSVAALYVGSRYHLRFCHTCTCMVHT